MKKALLLAAALLVTPTAALAEEWNFGGHWDWADAQQDARYADTWYYLTLFPDTISNHKILGRYCVGEDQCWDIVATETADESLTFTINGNFFEFTLDSENRQLNGAYWQGGLDDGFPDAHISMTPLGD